MHSFVGHDEYNVRLSHWTGCRLVNIAQVARIDPVVAWRCLSACATGSVCWASPFQQAGETDSALHRVERSVARSYPREFLLIRSRATLTAGDQSLWVWFETTGRLGRSWCHLPLAQGAGEEERQTVIMARRQRVVRLKWFRVEELNDLWRALLC